MANFSSARIRAVPGGEDTQRQHARKTAALQIAVFNNADFYNIATDEKGVIQLFNAGAERLLGYAAADVVNRLTPADLCDPQALIARATALGRAFATPIAAGFEALVYHAARGIVDSYALTCIRKDGSRVALVVSVSALHGSDGGRIGYLMVGIDNTARKHAEDKLRWTEESFRLMVECVTDCAIVMLDPQGFVMSWNTGAQRIQGYREDEIVGQHFSLFYGADALAGGKAGRDLEAAAAQGRFEDEGWRTRKDGSVFWANVVFTPIRGPLGELRGFAKLTRDLTQHRRAEAALTDARSVAEKANQQKSDFLSSMSHELRSPLNAILGFAQLMELDSPPPTAAQQSSLDQILKGGWYLLDLINEILDLASIESGKLSLSLEPLSLHEVIRDCRMMIEPQLQQRGIRMQSSAGDTWGFVHADRTRLKQVLLNLLSNAIKYNRQNGTVTLLCRPVARGRLRISVHDTGEGMPADKLAHLFEPFNRLGQESGAQQGTGMGLVVSKRLVELMGGAFGVASTPGVGSEFWLELGTAEPPQGVADPDATTDAPPPRSPDTPMRKLLYVEDNPANLKLVEQLIALRSDLHLLNAADGLLGVEMARAYQPELILMDLNLPGISGLDALKRLREDPATAHIPVVALSANAMPHAIRTGLEAGFYRYLTKPIKVNAFFATLDEGLALAQTPPAVFRDHPD